MLTPPSAVAADSDFLFLKITSDLSTISFFLERARDVAFLPCVTVDADNFRPVTDSPYRSWLRHRRHPRQFSKLKRLVRVKSGMYGAEEVAYIPASCGDQILLIPDPEGVHFLCYRAL